MSMMRSASSRSAAQRLALAPDAVGDRAALGGRMRPARLAEAAHQHVVARLEVDHLERDAGARAARRTPGNVVEEAPLAHVDAERDAADVLARALPQLDEARDERHRQVVDAVEAEVLEHVDRGALARARRARSRRRAWSGSLIAPPSAPRRAARRDSWSMRAREVRARCGGRAAQQLVARRRLDEQRQCCGPAGPGCARAAARRRGAVGARPRARADRRSSLHSMSSTTRSIWRSSSVASVPKSASTSITPRPRISMWWREQRRRAPAQHGRRDAPHEHDVVGDEAVAARHQVERRLALADAALARGSGRRARAPRRARRGAASRARAAPRARRSRRG